MVAFETLLLGVLFGRAPVRLMVAPPVASIELRLDGATLAVLHGPPWACDLDFEGRAMPHELTAVAFNSAGREVGRVTQWVNLGRQRAGVSVLLVREPSTGRPDAARVTWTSIDVTAPDAVAAQLDGKPLAVSDPHHIRLPETDLGQPHLLSIDVAFGDDRREQANLAFGGDVLDSAESELTAIAVELPPGQRSFTLADARGLFRLDQVPIEPLAVEKSRAEVAVVVDQGTWTKAGTLPCWWGPPTDPPKLKPDRDRFYLVNTVANRVQGSTTVGRLFPSTCAWKLSSLDAYCVLRAFRSSFALPQRQTIADAVAVACAEVAALNHRRAVVLLLADDALLQARGDLAAYDGSTIGIAAAKAYLDALSVPLVVWSLAGPAAGPLTAAWGRAEDVSTPRKLRAAFKRLEARLDAQRIVWFSGRHLPQRITLDDSATSLRIAR